MRCALAVEDQKSGGKAKHILVGCTGGLLLRLDPVNFFVTLRIQLHKHIFCLLQLDSETVLCGQLGGYLDLVRVSDGTVLLSEDLCHTTGNIISMCKLRAPRRHEIALAT